MSKSIEVEINFDGLPATPNQHKLVVALEKEINDAVSRAVTACCDDPMRTTWEVRVPEF